MPPGSSLEVPCTGCGSNNEVELESLTDSSAEVRCLNCGELLIVMREPGLDALPTAHDLESSLETTRADDRDTDLGDGPDESSLAPAASPSPSSGDDPREDLLSCPACGHRFHADHTREPRPSVLVVEDTDFFLELATEVLGRHYRTIGVKTAADALEVLRRETVDLVVLDLSLPDGDGELILGATRDPELPVLIYTSGSERVMLGDAWARLQSMGASDLLLKSVNVEEALVEKVGRLLRRPGV